jgi:hypothetical protein
MVRCLTYVRSALKSGRTANAVTMTKYGACHRSNQPSTAAAKAPDFLKSAQENLGDLRGKRGPQSGRGPPVPAGRWVMLRKPD